jgi:hypothetical protein
VLPLQDLLTKILADLTVADEYYALPLRYFTGVMEELTDDGSHGTKKFHPWRDRMLTFHGENTKGGAFPAADVRQIADIGVEVVGKIARVTGIPLHYWIAGEGDFPSGEALRTAEARLIAKCADLQDDWGPQWSKVLELCGYDVSPKWTDPVRLTESEKLERLAQKKALGVPWEQLMSEMGYDEAEVTKMRGQKDAEEKRKADVFAQSFDAG